MKTEFTKTTANFGCYTSEKLQDKHLKNESFTIDDILNAEVSLRDKAWFIRKNCEFTDQEYREFAIGCALVVLPIYESKYSGNNAPRKAIEAAKAYLDGTIDLEALRESRHYAAYAAADAAYAAADAAYAAAAATAAADAAYAAAADAAYAAADAAYAAADAAATAAADVVAYAAPSYKASLLQFFKEFTSVKESTQCK